MDERGPKMLMKFRQITRHWNYALPFILLQFQRPSNAQCQSTTIHALRKIGIRKKYITMTQKKRRMQTQDAWRKLFWKCGHSQFESRLFHSCCQLDLFRKLSTNAAIRYGLQRIRPTCAKVGILLKNNNIQPCNYLSFNFFNLSKFIDWKLFVYDK